MTSEAERLRNALRELIGEHRRDGMLPTSARFLFYELVTRGIIAKASSGARRPDQNMHVALTQLRERGEVPWEWIVDETRALHSFNGYASIKAGVLAQLDYIRLDPWRGDEPLILTESRSLAGVLESLCWDYCVRLAPTNGQVAWFLHTRVAPILRSGHRVLYFGDFDLCGNDIEANTKRVLERASGYALDWQRLALTLEQVDQYDLPRIPKTDRRFKNGAGVHEAVVTEALSQRLIVEILRARLAELIPEPLERAQARAKRQRTKMRRTL